MAGMWLDNARERRVDRGLEGDLAATGSETLTIDGENAFLRSKVRFGFGFAEWRRGDMRITAFVPRGVDARLILIENAPSELCWTLRPGLAYERRDAAFVQTRVEDGALRARNPRGGDPGLDFGAAFTGALALDAEHKGRSIFTAR